MNYAKMNFGDTDVGDIDYGDTVFAAQRRHRKRARMAEAIPVSSAKRLVLIIDDSPELAKALGEILHSIGLDYVVANSGKYGLEVYGERGHEIDLVMLDMNMPQMNGEQTLEALREIDPGVNVLIASSASEEEIRRRCKAQGVVAPHCLQKTDGMGAIVEEVQKALGSID